MKAIPAESLKRAAAVLRGLAADAVQKAKSGHPGLPIGMADVAATLWLNHLRVSARDPQWHDRDRFVLSGGHGSALLYSLLHEAGFPVSLDDLKSFRQWGSTTPGHPERTRTCGVEVTTGPLGQGIANAVGMAISQAMLAARFNRDGEKPLFDHNVWCFCGDGDLEEGISHEAASLAGALRLSKLVLLYDDNGISIEGDVKAAFRDDTRKRFEAYGWRVIGCDGHDPADIDKALRRAKRSDRPTLVTCRTVIGWGCPTKAGKACVHGEPLGEEELRAAKAAWGLPPDESFHDPEDVRALWAARSAEMHRAALRSTRALRKALEADPERAALHVALLAEQLPADLPSRLPDFADGKPVATRAASGAVLQALAAALPGFIGGSADLAPSNKTWLKDFAAIAPGAFGGKNLQFGIRELGMTAVQNGILADGFFRVFTATFAVFADYMKPAMRVAALSKLPALYVLTHDSYAVGEDGATHEPVEQLAMLRATPGIVALRPADATETAAAWLAALAQKERPAALLLSRQNLPVLDRSALPPAALVAKGAYTLWQNGTGTPEAIILASGSEVHLAMAAAKARPGRNVRVVSFPSWELFEDQPQAYRDEVLPPACTRRLVIEAGSSMGWEKWAGPATDVTRICLDHYGESAPAGVLAEKFGFTEANAIAKLDALLA